MIKCLQLPRLLLWVAASLLITLAGTPQGSNARAQQKSDTKFEEDFPTPLLQAIILNQPKAVRTLLSEGASPNGVDHSNYTKIPLLLATERRNVQIVKMLLDAGAEKEIRQNLGLTALFLAVGNQDLEMVQYLVIRGANVNAKGDEGATPIMLAVQLGAIPIMKVIISAGADVNAANNYGVTALMAASDNSDVVELLVKANAKLETADEDGSTAACYARRSNQAKKLAALLKNGAKDIPCPQ